MDRLAVVVREREGVRPHMEQWLQDGAVEEREVEPADRRGHVVERVGRSRARAQPEPPVGEHTVELAGGPRPARRQRLHREPLREPDDEHRRRQRERTAHQAVRRQDHEPFLVHVGDEGEHARRALRSPALLPVGQRALVAVVAVRDEHRLRGQRRLHAPDGGRVGHAPHPIPVAVRARDVDERPGLGHRPEPGPHALTRTRVQPEDRAQVRPGGTQEGEPVGLRTRKGALVRAHDAARELLQTEAAEDPLALPRRAVGEAERLHVRVDRRLGVLTQQAGFDPAPERVGRGRRPVRLARQDQTHDVVGALLVERRLLGRRDHVVRWGDDLAQIADLRGIVAHPMQRAHDGHRQRPSRAARSVVSARGPARSTRTRSPSTAATVDAPPGSSPPSTYAATRTPK